MECRFLEKISILIDGELPIDEIERVRTHAEGCEDCRTAREDFLSFRREIKNSTFHSAPFVDGLRNRESKKGRFILSRSIVLPIPVFAALLLVLVAAGVWIFSSGFERKSQPVESGVAGNSSMTEADRQNIPSAASLAKFDRGGRAEIYVVRNESPASESK